MLRNLVLLCLGITLCNARLSAQELIRWHEDLNQARQISQQYKVPILIHFYGDNCVPCKTLEKNVFTRSEVASTIQRYFVPVHINATQDRRTAAQYGVHSWPTDVFVAPDGKILTQGVCNQNAAAYLQSLQSVAVMNRDRNLMLAGNTPPAQAAGQPPAQASAQPSTPAGAAAPRTAQAYAAATQGSDTARQATSAAPYGRLATTSLQQAAPGRDQAPAPYNNPSSGAGPYAAAQTAAAPNATGPNASAQNGPQPGFAPQSLLPSPTWNGQSAHGQAASGLVGAGPLSNTSGMTVPAATPGTSPMYKDPNLPQSAQTQAGPMYQPGPAPAAAPTLGSNWPPSAVTPPVPGMAAAPTLPASAKPTEAPASGSFSATAAGNVNLAKGAVVENPHFANKGQAAGTTQPAMQAGPYPPSNGKGPAAQMVSASGSVDKVTSVAEPPRPASVPALSGYCPVELLAASQWVEGKPEHAIRHRGRVYFLSSAEAAQKFLAAPDSYCPVLSGYDPLILLRDGVLVEGSVYSGLKDATQNRILLFSSPENKKHFQDNYDRLATELDNLLKPAEPRTAPAPATTLSR